MPPPKSMVDIFGEFIRLRKNGTNRDDAWFDVLDMHPDLTSKEIDSLLTMAKKFERDEGNKYTYHSDSTSTQTIPKVKKQQTPPSQETEESVIKPLKPRPRNMGLTGDLDPRTLRDQDQKRLDQILNQSEFFRKPEQRGQRATGRLPVVQQEEKKAKDYFTLGSVLLLHFKDAPKPAPVRFRNCEIEVIIGRSTENGAMTPDVDLGIINGEEYGVSRMHAAMKFENNQILITDLGSTNHTYVNGSRLFPDEVRILQHDDEVWFGGLLCKIEYLHPE